MKNIDKQKIKFDNMPWQTPKEGVMQKVYSDGTSRMRLLRFEDNFIEEEWCRSGHVGVVLEGEMLIDFNGDTIAYKKGEGLWIEAGEDHKHKVIIKKGKRVELILFEDE